ncbi:MAG: cation transporter [Deltaproteobacteria bacterium]|nr:cation transporter [Deltaproteobacteria bacterium]
MKDQVRYNKIKRVTLISIAVNIFLTIFKFLAGVLGSSHAMIADAAHTLSDLLTDAVVIGASKYGNMPVDRDHPYGHGKIETFGSLVLAAFLAIAGIWIIYSAAVNISGGGSGIPGKIALIAAIVSIIFKEFLYQITIKVGKEVESDAVKANAWHHRSDSLSSIAALLGIGGSMIGFRWLDPAAAMVVAAIILKVTYDITVRSAKELVETAIPVERQREILKAIKEVNGVVAVHEMRTRNVGARIFVDVHVQVDREISVSEGHQIAVHVKQKVLEHISNVGDVLIHIDSEDDAAAEFIGTRRERVEEIVRAECEPYRDLLEITAVTIHYYRDDVEAIVGVKVKEDMKISEINALLEGIRNKAVASGEINRMKIMVAGTE